MTLKENKVKKKTESLQRQMKIQLKRMWWKIKNRNPG